MALRCNSSIVRKDSVDMGKNMCTYNAIQCGVEYQYTAHGGVTYAQENLHSFVTLCFQFLCCSFVLRNTIRCVPFGIHNRSQSFVPLISIPFFPHELQNVQKDVDNVHVECHGTKDVIVFVHAVLCVLATNDEFRVVR